MSTRPTLEQFAINYDVDVYLYPNPGAGVQVVNVPGRIGETMAVPVPFKVYNKVRELRVWPDKTLEFKTASGDWIESNLPYIVHRTPKPAHEA